MPSEAEATLAWKKSISSSSTLSDISLVIICASDDVLPVLLSYDGISINVLPWPPLLCMGFLDDVPDELVDEEPVSEDVLSSELVPCSDEVSPEVLFSEDDSEVADDEVPELEEADELPTDDTFEETVDETALEAADEASEPVSGSTAEAVTAASAKSTVQPTAATADK